MLFRDFASCYMIPYDLVVRKSKKEEEEEEDFVRCQIDPNYLIDIISISSQFFLSISPSFFAFS